MCVIKKLFISTYSGKNVCFCLSRNSSGPTKQRYLCSIQNQTWVHYLKTNKTLDTIGTLPEYLGNCITVILEPGTQPNRNMVYGKIVYR